MDTATGDVGAVEFTSSREGDSPVLPGLLAQIPPDQQVGTVTADGAYADRVKTHLVPSDRKLRAHGDGCWPAFGCRESTGRAGWSGLPLYGG